AENDREDGMFVKIADRQRDLIEALLDIRRDDGDVAHVNHIQRLVEVDAHQRDILATELAHVLEKRRAEKAREVPVTAAVAIEQWDGSVANRRGRFEVELQRLATH